ncbi:hypothetical protein DSCO28_50360 [Desulfosarcina ovata subsp. sediminis]|uniref:Uncharacterized protein n=1 Tax=Desulfosarcina ovata subsp. sediminis TaxID=885957 RepID=A0A5K7ZFS3_9BACT|nr:hypothetical protein [Desulfosarcina ovata]BBO80164.1 hypothetical protein DSCO28_07300 [Desulfosarcina ovata subsp. sediminis]BBO84470.1 hypothetical protein DSCO28_50360 [Desulfosarcina ovata subsp. sediminis]
MNTLQVYTALAEAAGEFNRIAVRLRSDDLTKAKAEELAKAKIEELAKKFE